MKRSTPARLAILMLTLGCSTPVLAICDWDGTPAGELVHNISLGDFWVPRDAPVGTVIGPLDVRHNVGNDAGLNLICHNINAIEYLTTQVTNTAPLFPGTLPPVGGEDLNGRILQTSIPGVGLHVRLDNPYTGGAQNHWKPVTWHSVPYEGYSDHRTGPLGINMQRLRAMYTLVKTGTIPPGPNNFGGQQILSGTYSDVGRVMRAHVHGTVTSAQCTLKPDAVSADPVDLGSHDLSAFTGEHSTTPAVAFHINLNDCEDDPSGSTATAYLHFDGTHGSTPIEPDQGLFSLNTRATAQGIGIELLHADGTPVRLQQDLPMTRLSLGNMQVHFQARYYQTDPSVKPGSAEGNLSFTVSYR